MNAVLTRLGIRPTIRARLTLLYGAAFLIAGVALVATTTFLAVRALDENLPRAAAVEVPLGTTAVPLDAGGQVISTDELTRLLDQQRQGVLEDARSSLVRLSLLALGVVGVGAVGLGYVVAGQALRPLAQVTATARRVAGLRMHERIALDGPSDEVKELADTFDDMLERLDRAFESQRRFVANASHELRTPLAVNRTLLEVALGDQGVSDDLRRLGTTLLATNGRSERLIDGLLLLATSEREIPDRRPLDLADIARHSVETVAMEATRLQVTLGASLSPAPVEGDPVLLERLVLNLLQNAVRHNAIGGAASIGCGSDGRRSWLEVSNSGPVVPAYEVDGLFEPFRRGSERVHSDRGVGLGLSIVRAIAVAHGGEVAAVPRDGGGLTVRAALSVGRHQALQAAEVRA